MFLWSKLLCCPLHDSLMIFLRLLSFCLILLTFAPLLGSQWYLVFGLRHKKYFRSVQMSRVQHRGEPDPLYAAAGQRSVLNCQSPGRDRISAHLMFKHVLWCAGDRICVFENNIYHICFSGSKALSRLIKLSSDPCSPQRLYDLAVLPQTQWTVKQSWLYSLYCHPLSIPCCCIESGPTNTQHWSL